MKANYRKAAELVERDINHLRKVKAALIKKADHDVIDDYAKEREEDLSYQRKGMGEYLRDVDKKVSSSVKVADEDEVEEMEEATEELEKTARLQKKSSVLARAKNVCARLDKVSDVLERTNPKLAARLDMVANTIEKKYGLKK